MARYIALFKNWLWRFSIEHNLEHYAIESKYGVHAHVWDSLAVNQGNCKFHRDLFLTFLSRFLSFKVRHRDSIQFWEDV